MELPLDLQEGGGIPFSWQIQAPGKQYMLHVVCLKFSFSLSDATHHLGNKPPGSVNPY